MRDVAALDFVGYESGPWRTFGRAWKLDRATVAATVGGAGGVAGAATTRRGWPGYEELAARLAEAVGGSLCQFTLDERVLDGGPFNAVLRARARRAWCDALADGDPSVRAMTDGDDLLLCVETVSSSEVDELAAAVSACCQN